MRDNFNVKIFEQWLKRNFIEDISSAPINSMTPVVGELPDGKQEYIFIVKAESWLSEPLKGRSIDDTVPMAAKAYMEGSTLIWGFDIELGGIKLECEIPANKIKKFLSLMVRQDKLTVIMVDHITMNVVWMTNNYPFWRVKDQFKILFEHFEIKHLKY